MYLNIMNDRAALVILEERGMNVPLLHTVMLIAVFPLSGVPVAWVPVSVFPVAGHFLSSP